MGSGRLVLGVDVARFGADRSVVAVLQGPVVRDFHAWQGADLEVSAGRVIEVARRYGIRRRRPRRIMEELGLTRSGFGDLVAAPGDPLEYMEHAHRAGLRIDAIGLGAGLHDRLAHDGWPVEAFNAASKAVGPQAERFANRRAQALFDLRHLLEAGELALPPTHRDVLTRELTSITWWVTGTGKVLIESKGDVRAKLGASPDYSDALAMAVTSDGAVSFDVEHAGAV